jgi:hypothetical protein
MSQKSLIRKKLTGGHDDNQSVKALGWVHGNPGLGNRQGKGENMPTTIQTEEVKTKSEKAEKSDEAISKVIQERQAFINEFGEEIVRKFKDEKVPISKLRIDFIDRRKPDLVYLVLNVAGLKKNKVEGAMIESAQKSGHPFVWNNKPSSPAPTKAMKKLAKKLSESIAEVELKPNQKKTARK